MSLLQRAEKWTQQWKEEGLAEGRAEGRAEGLAEGRVEGSRLAAAKILKSQLQLRFGDLPSPVIDRIDRTDVDTLERWAYRVLDAGSLEEVLREDSETEDR